MKTRSLEFAMVATLAILWSIRGVIGIRFVIDREECFSHNVEYDGDTIHLSFVVIKFEGSWHYAPDGADQLEMDLQTMVDCVVYKLQSTNIAEERLWGDYDHRWSMQQKRCHGLTNTNVGSQTFIYRNSSIEASRVKVANYVVVVQDENDIDSFVQEFFFWTEDIHSL